MKLQIFQSLWGMEKLVHPGQPEPSLAEKLGQIAEAGFEGVEFCMEDLALTKQIVGILKDVNLKCSCIAFPETGDELKPIIERVLEFGATHINIQPMPKPETVEEGIPYLLGCQALSDEAGVEVFFETHRDRMTTDLIFTLHLIDAVPGITLTADLSHFLVGREFPYPVSEENHNLMRRILARTGAYHARVASREQVQVQISFPHNKIWLDLFLQWWEEGMRMWRAKAAADATLTFVTELGPPFYAMTGPDGQELSDRW
jgi:sugar phosphate isomerase/epimerase